jgi:hypothetical protein
LSAIIGTVLDGLIEWNRHAPHLRSSPPSASHLLRMIVFHVRGLFQLCCCCV